MEIMGITVYTRRRHTGTMRTRLTCAFENFLHIVNVFFNAEKLKNTEMLSEKVTDHQSWKIKVIVKRLF